MPTKKRGRPAGSRNKDLGNRDLLTVEDKENEEPSQKKMCCDSNVVQLLPEAEVAVQPRLSR